jgi:hypothetical protein
LLARLVGKAEPPVGMRLRDVAVVSKSASTIVEQSRLLI